MSEVLFQDDAKNKLRGENEIILVTLFAVRSNGALALLLLLLFLLLLFFLLLLRIMIFSIECLCFLRSVIHVPTSRSWWKATARPTRLSERGWRNGLVLDREDHRNIRRPVG